MGLLDKFKNKSTKVKLKEEKSRQSAPKLQADKKDNGDKTLAQLNEGKVKQEVGSDKSVKKVAGGDTKRAYRILIKPMVTEKGTYLASEKKYIFEVDAKANKIEVKKAIEAVYNVTAVKVNIVNLSGKKVRYGKVRGKTKDRKKAIVTLKEGQTINVYEGV